MKDHLFKFFLVLMVVSCKQQGQDAMVNNSQKGDPVLSSKIDAVIKDYQELQIFSGIVLVAEQGNLVFHKAYGLADRSVNKANQLNTLFDIGSMNKTFTSIVVKQLISEGKLKYDDRLIDHVPGFKDPNANKITIDHLLNHQSGFGDYHSRDYFDLPKSERTLQAIVNRAKSVALNFVPGEEDDYSNLGYVILGAVIEKVSGLSYFANVKERIVDPLQLKNTYLNNFDNLESRTAKGYYFTPLGTLEENASIMDEPNPDGGFLSTTEDIMKFYRSYYYDTILLSDAIKSKDPMFQFLANIPEGKATGAAGGFEGFNTALYQIYKEDITIIVFANMDEPVAEHIALDILALTRNETPEKPKLPAVQNVRIQFDAHGPQYIKDHFEELTTNFHPEDPKDIILNALGYAYLYEVKDTEKAISYFKLNTELFPNVANCWDSYGEALLQNGKKDEAKLAYMKALELRPNLQSAREALKKLN